jgi:MOSC domain-containing protein YiiM
MSRVDPISERNVEFVTRVREGMPEIEPSVPVIPCWNLSWKLE